MTEKYETMTEKYETTWKTTRNKYEKLETFIKPTKINPFLLLRSTSDVVFHADSEKHTPDA